VHVVLVVFLHVDVSNNLNIPLYLKPESYIDWCLLC
jgi:hypothetical protein